MGFFSFLHRPQTPQERVVPLFPLNTVLFPGGVLGLQVFEARYLDMTTRCLREQSPFGVCLVSGRQEDDILATHPVGTLATIRQADVEQAGILLLTVQGGARFRILETTHQDDKLMLARVQLFPHREKVAPPPERSRLLPFLKRIVSDLGPEKMAEPYDFDDAEWVGFRLTEVLPVQNLAKQKLLELSDPLERLKILERYLEQRKLLG